MGQALYRAYRPKSLSEVIGQEHITDSLRHALKQGKLAHAYLFTGPRGVGKTSIARILAHEINGLPYTDDSMHLDIIEIDAASNRRIDEIRELRDKVNVAPSMAKYKVYIIDEVHMLTREAFNALLKTLEEPPAHVVFILATTESHKLPDTIISRTQRFMFKPVSMEKVTAHLRSIADKEGMKVSDEALGLIADYGEGSFRDSISLLDQTRGHDGNIDGDAVRLLTGVPTTDAIDAICAALNQADASAVSRSLSALRDQGFGAAQVARQLGQRMRQQVLEGKAQAFTFPLMEKLLEVPVAHDPESYLELVVLATALESTIPAAPVPTPAPAVAVAAVPMPPTPALQPAKTMPKPNPASESEPTPGPRLSVVTPKATEKPVAKPAKAAPRAAESEEKPTTSGRHGKPLAEVDAAVWPAIVSRLKKTHNTLYGIIRMATPIFYEDAIELHFTFAFHKKRLGETKNQEVVANVIQEVTGRPMALRCVLDSKDSPKPTQASVAMASGPDNVPVDPLPSASPVSAISNIFGGAEILDR
jgi:DNA polymerase III subunit gamma/tau